MQVTVTVVNLENQKVHEFKIDPTKHTYVAPEGSKFGYIFEPEEIPPPEGDGGQQRIAGGE
jgi:hypothetical protein